MKPSLDNTGRVLVFNRYAIHETAYKLYTLCGTLARLPGLGNWFTITHLTSFGHDSTSNSGLNPDFAERLDPGAAEALAADLSQCSSMF